MVCLALGGIVRSDDIPRNGGDGDRSDVIPLRASKSAAFIVKSAIRRGGGKKGSLKGSVMLSKGFRSAWHIYKSTTLADLPLEYTAVLTRADKKSQVRQCLGFCAADFWYSPMSQLNKNPNIALLETSYQL